LVSLLCRQISEVSQFAYISVHRPLA